MLGVVCLCVLIGGCINILVSVSVVSVMFVVVRNVYIVLFVYVWCVRCFMLLVVIDSLFIIMCFSRVGDMV